MIDVSSALAWQALIKRAQSGELPTDELLEAAELQPVAKGAWPDGIARALVHVALVFNDDASEKLGDRCKLREPQGKAVQRSDAAFERRYANGLAVFVPAYSNNVLVDFNGAMRVLSSPGGGIFLKPDQPTATGAV